MDDPIKKAGTLTTFTPWMAKELKKCSSDPIYFIETYCRIVHPTKGEVPFILYDYQKVMIEMYERKDMRKTMDGEENPSYGKPGNCVSLVSRQMGKTEVACAYMLWNAMFRPNQNILVAANKFDQAKEIIKRMKQVYAACPSWIKPGIKADGWNMQSIKLENGSTVLGIATTADSGRGKSISLLYVDEFAFVAPNMAKEFWAAIRPTLSTGGRCIITSTPNNDDDEFAGIWFGANDTFDEYNNPYPDDYGRNNFRAFSTIWDSHPERNMAWKNKELQDIGEERFRREHECEFLSFDETLINPIFMANQLNSFVKDPKRRTRKIRWYEDILPNHQYIVGWDPCIGTGEDNAAIQVFRLPDMVQVAEWSHNRTRVDGQCRILLDILCELDEQLRRNPAQKYEPEIFWSVENNVIGEAALLMIEHTGEENFPGYFVSEARNGRSSGRKYRKGFTTSNKTKLEACVKFKALLEQGRMDISSAALVREIKFFVRYGEYISTSYKAKDGEHDDLILAILLCIRITQVIIKWDEGLMEELSDDIGTDDYAGPMPTLI